MQATLFHFFVSGEQKEVFPDSRLFNVPLSGENYRVSNNTPSEYKTKGLDITIGEYFSAAYQFLLKNASSILKTGLGAVLNTQVQIDQITRIDIFLEKHGAFYHPLKVQVTLNENQLCSFVLNGAVSRSGLALIKAEYHLIASLNKAHDRHYLPKVFGLDFIKTDKGGIGFFLGEWFEDYKEFHVTDHQDKRQIVLWESDGSCHYITEAEAHKIYLEIARVLTYYYNLETAEQISGWHHAAGDFIVKKEGQSVHVRLITVRGYLPLSEFEINEENKNLHILPSLLWFFLNLSLKMRLDRLNGTGKTVMLGKIIMNAAIDGFLEGLDEKSTIYDFGDLRSIFIEFFHQFTIGQLIGITSNIVEFHYRDPLEITLLEKNLESHCKALYLAFSIKKI